MTATDPQPESNRPIPLELIKERARKLWEERGGDSTRDVENWLDAEKELRFEQMQLEQAQRRMAEGRPRRSRQK